MRTDDVVWLQEWFSNRANGDWEHSFGVKIETLDNPGWRVVIDLADTPLANKAFASVREQKTEADWLSCRVQAGKFEGFCGPKNLLQVLAIFRSWSEK